MAQAKLVRVPGKAAMRLALQFFWKSGISAIPPEALPYMTGEYTMNTERLRKFLGSEYEPVIRYSITDAFADSFAKPASPGARLRRRLTRAIAAESPATNCRTYWGRLFRTTLRLAVNDRSFVPTI